MVASLNRRELLSGGAALALAGPISLPDVLRGQLPAPVRALLPQDARGALDLIGELLKLEQEAKVLRLPTGEVVLLGELADDVPLLERAVRKLL